MYKKKHTMIKRPFTLVLALVLIMVMGLSLTVPSKAAEEGGGNNNGPFQIDIVPNDNVSTPTGGSSVSLETRFWAYQIFIGRVSSSYKNDESGNDGYRDGTTPSEPGHPGQDIVNPKANQLSDVQWGASIITGQIDALLEALKGSGVSAAGLGVTYQRMEYAGDVYLDSENTNIKGYVEAYQNESYWEGDKIGGEMTPDGEAAIKSALEKVTLGDLFKARLGDTTGSDAAALVAKVLSDFTDTSGNTALAQAFTDIVAEKYPVGDPQAGEYKYLLNAGGTAKGKPESSSETYDGAYAVSRWDSVKNCWSIGNSDNSNTDAANLSGGYYLIRDKYSEKGNDGKSSSGYILAVFGNNTIYPKADIPTADKTIVGAENPDNAGSFEIGKEITFQVKGTLPENYDTDYDKYFYNFTDTMDEGLTYIGGGKEIAADKVSRKLSESASPVTDGFTDVLRVYVKVPGETGEFTEGTSKYDYYLVELDLTDSDTSAGKTYDFTYADAAYEAYTGNGYWLNITENVDGSGKTEIMLSIPDLKKLMGKKVSNPEESDNPVWENASSSATKIPIIGGSEIYVEYTAALNENAVVNSRDGNMNSVDLEYSNDPNWQGTGKPPTGTTETENKTHVYDFGVAINKYDGSEGEYNAKDNAMENVGFALTKSEKWYPYFTSDSDTAADGWVSEADVLAYLAHFGIDEANTDDYFKGDKNLPVDDNISPIPAAGKYLKSSGSGAPAADNMTAYALFKEVIGNPKHYAIVGWIPEAELKTVLDVTTGTITDNDWIKSITGNTVVNYLGAGFETTDEYYLAIQTDEKGYLRIEGMSSDIEYFLMEVVTPDGYDTIDPISVRFGAEYNDDGTLKNATKNVNDDGDEPIYETKGEIGNWAEDYSELVITQTVPNYPAGYLPGTGGMGTTLFYIAGVALLAGAALFLIFSNIKKKTGQRVR